MGEYGDIASRSAFRKKVDEALERTKKLLETYPAHPAFESILMQLTEMKRSTDGRDPDERERGSLDVGLVAVRELDGFRDEDVTALDQLIHPLAAFYEDWPTDDVAAREASA
jgi:hypothetical protein